MRGRDRLTCPQHYIFAYTRDSANIKSERGRPLAENKRGTGDLGIGVERPPMEKEKYPRQRCTCIYRVPHSKLIELIKGKMFVDEFVKRIITQIITTII